MFFVKYWGVPVEVERTFPQTEIDTELRGEGGRRAHRLHADVLYMLNMPLVHQKLVRYIWHQFSLRPSCPSALPVIVLKPSLSFFFSGRNSIMGRRPQVLRPWSAAAAVYIPPLRPLLLRGQRSVWYGANGPVMAESKWGLVAAESLWDRFGQNPSLWSRHDLRIMSGILSPDVIRSLAFTCDEHSRRLLSF